MTAIPLTLLGAVVQVKIGKLTDTVQDKMAEFLYELEQVMQQ